MPLQLSLDRSVFISQDCKTVTVRDNTGIYDAIDNPTGYGGPNQDRSDLALFLQVESYKDNGELDKNELVLGVDPALDTSWNFEQDVDGYYKFKLIGVPLWSPAIAFNAEELTYLQNTESLYKALQATTGDDPESSPLIWQNVSIEDTLTNNGLVANTTNLFISLDFDYVLACRAAKCYLDSTLKYTKSITGEPCNCEDDGLKDWQKIHALYNGVLSLIVQERYLDAQQVVKQIAEICEELNCGCQC